MFVGKYNGKSTASSQVEVPSGLGKFPLMGRTVVAGVAVVIALAGCGGGKDFANKPRPPETLELTGVITNEKVTISPAKVGAGPVEIKVSNQSGAARTLTIDGNGEQESTGPISPLSVGTLQKTLKPGRYTVKVGSEAATAKVIRPATLVIGKERASASDKVLLP